MKRFAYPQDPRRHGVWGLVLVLLLVARGHLGRENLLAEGGRIEARPLPEFQPGASRWIGCAPMTTADLRGRVWVLEVWTFGCSNCIRSVPFTNSLVERFGDRVGVLGIHSPEFDRERDEEALREALREHDLKYPTYVDTSDHYFNALESPGWPAFYVVDRDARIRGRWVGEIHRGTLRAKQLEGLVEALLDGDA